MKSLLLLLLFCSFLCAGQTNSFVTEYYLSQNFTPKAGVTPGSNNTLWMSCDQILARYNVTISGVTTTGNRWPSQNQLTADCNGLNLFIIYDHISINFVGTDFTGSLTSAKQAAYDVNDKRGRTVSMGTNPIYDGRVRATSLTAGNPIYIDDGECTFLDAGYYVYATNGTKFDKIIHVQPSGTINSVTDALQVGDALGGGHIAYILSSGDPGYSATEINGLVIASTVNLSRVWGCSGLDISTSSAIGSGSSNTAAILGACGDITTAAKWCDVYSEGVFDDYYLPSSGEQLNCMAGGAYTYYADGVNYWSSTQAGSPTTAIYNYRSGTTPNIGTQTKTQTYRALPVRSF